MCKSGKEKSSKFTRKIIRVDDVMIYHLVNILFKLYFVCEIKITNLSHEPSLTRLCSIISSTYVIFLQI
jgi:hypothetical protein